MKTDFIWGTMLFAAIMSLLLIVFGSIVLYSGTIMQLGWGLLFILAGGVMLVVIWHAENELRELERR